jgi:hypothetical protein
MNIKLKKPQINNLNSAFSSRKKLIAAAILLLIVGLIGLTIWQQKEKAPATEEEAYQKVIEVNSLRVAGDCQKGLDQLASYNTKKVNLSEPAAQETVADVLKYRVDCHYELKQYDDALTSAIELKKLYEDNNWSNNQIQSISKTIELIMADKETAESMNEFNEKSRNAEDSYDGPRL